MSAESVSSSANSSLEHSLEQPSVDDILYGNGTHNDDDFDLPEVDHVPSVEEILAEDDVSEFFPIDEFNEDAKFVCDGDSSDVTSVASTARRGVRKKEWKMPERKPCKSDSLRFVRLRGVSKLLLGAINDRVLNSGIPTALAVSSLMAVGTSHGVVFVFDHEQKLRYRFGSSSAVQDLGNVSALDFSRDSSRLLVGFARGQLRMYDTEVGKLLRTVTADQAHSVGQAVVHLRFTNDKTVAICSDTGGSVFELTFTRRLGVRGCDTKCIFSGCKGEVAALAPLVLPDHIDAHVAVEPLLLGMATLTKVIVARLRPKLQVIFACALGGSAECLPGVAWNFVPVSFNERSRIVDPVLMFGRERSIHFYHCGVLSQGEAFKFSPLQRIDLPDYSFVNFCWLNVRSVLILDDSEQLHLFDVSCGEHIEQLDASSVELVYQTSDFKGYATGCNVSQALAFAAKYACFQSMAALGGQAFLLGMKSVEVVNMRTWMERINALVKEGSVMDAIQLALDFYDGKMRIGTAAVSNLKQMGKQRDIISDRIVELLISYADLSLTKNCPSAGKLGCLADHYMTAVTLCIDTCIKLKRLDLLFDQIYAKFAEDPMAHGFFLECLEEYIRDETITSVPPLVIQSFVSHMEREGLLSTIESCIVRLDVACLDLHQIMTTCRRHGLYDGIAYVFNKALKDYTSPLKEIFPVLQKIVQKEFLSDEDIKLGNRILLYVCCCLCGRAYPVGELSPEEAETVSNKLYQFITSVKSHTVSIDDRPYPYLRTLLKFDTREFLNVLAMAFDSPDFQRSDNSRAQHTLDMLIEVMLDGSSGDFTTFQIGTLFTFVCRLMISKPDRLFVRRDQLHLLLESSLCSVEEGVVSSSSLEKQQALLDLLQATDDNNSILDRQRVLQLAEKAHLYQVCEWIYLKQRRFDKIIDCYVSNPFVREQSLSNLVKLLSSKDTLSAGEIQTVRAKFLEHLSFFIELDSRQCGEALIDLSIDSVANVCRQLIREQQRESLCKLLTDIYEYKKSSGDWKFVDENSAANDEIIETWLRLLAEFQPDSLLPLLSENELLCTENVLKICEKAKLNDAVIFLLEKKGRVTEAFQHMLTCLKNALSSSGPLLDNTSQDSSGDVDPKKNYLFLLVASVNNGIAFCRRNSDGIPSADREKMWLSILDEILSTQRQQEERRRLTMTQSGSDSTNECIVPNGVDFRPIISNLVNAMISYVDASVLLQRLFESPLYRSGRYGEFEPLLSGMLLSYTFDELLLEKTLSCMHRELFDVLQDNTRALRRPILVEQQTCCHCDCSLTDNTNGNVRSVVFSCDHTFHVACLKVLNSFVRGRHGTFDWICPFCKEDLDSCDSSDSWSASSYLKCFQERPTRQGFKSGTRLTLQSGFKWTPNSFNFARETALRMQSTESENNPFQTDEGGGGDGLFEKERFRLKLAPPPLSQH